MGNKLLIVTFLIILNTISLQAQELSGTITDEAGRPVPWATVFVKELMFGTVANQDGGFELKLDPGEYTCVFQSMGYQTETRQVSVTRKTTPLRIILKPMVYNLSGVVVSSSGEDPAYSIMRQVIKKAPEYARMVLRYKADVYLRGTLEISKISRMVKWMAKEDLKEAGIKEGDVYLEESVNEVIYTAPSKVEQRVKSIRSNFPTDEDSKSSAVVGFIYGNLYKPDAFGNAWSPFAPGAFSHYRFSLEGTEINGNALVNKIRIIPKGKGPKYVRGHVFIVDGLWCIHSIDIKVEEQLGVDIQLSQTYGEVKPSVWMPVSNRVRVDVDLLGNAGNFLYNTSVRYLSLAVNTSLIPSVEPPPQVPVATSPAVTQKIDRLDKKSEKLKAKAEPTTSEAYRLARIEQKKVELKARDSLRNNHEFTERYKMTVDSNARRADTAFWNQVRPIPLSAVEVQGFEQSAPQPAHRKSAEGDSVRLGEGSNRLFPVILTGGRYSIGEKTGFSTNGLLNLTGLSFSAVDGFTYGSRFSFDYKEKGKYTINAGISPSYGFASGAFMWTASLGVEGHKTLKNSLKLSGGSEHPDFNAKGGPMPIENALSSLLFRQNLIRLYRSDFIRLDHSIRPFFGAKLKTALILSENSGLMNRSNFSLFYRDSREYDPNLPDNPGYLMERHRDMILNMEFSFKPMPFYFIKDGVKVARPGLNRAPEFFAGFRKAIPAGSFTSDYTRVDLGLRHWVSTGPGEQLSYEAAFGKYLSRKQVYFDDFTHFNAQPLILSGKDYSNAFHLIDYYAKSTDDAWVRVYAEYMSKYLLLTRVPLIRNRLWRDHISVAALATPYAGVHLEAGYGLGNSIYDFSFYAGIDKEKKPLLGLRISLPVFSSRQIAVGM